MDQSDRRSALRSATNPKPDVSIRAPRRLPARLSSPGIIPDPRFESAQEHVKTRVAGYAPMMNRM